MEHNLEDPQATVYGSEFLMFFFWGGGAFFGMLRSLGVFFLPWKHHSWPIIVEDIPTFQKENASPKIFRLTVRRLCLCEHPTDVQAFVEAGGCFHKHHGSWELEEKIHPQKFMGKFPMGIQWHMMTSRENVEGTCRFHQEMMNLC